MRRSVCGLVEFAYRRRGRKKDLRLAFPFLGSCVWVLQCLLAEFTFEGETETAI